MCRVSTCVTFGSVVLVLGIGDLRTKAAPPSEQLLPGTTAGFISISNVDRLRQHWDRTQLGQLAGDPIMEPFVNDLKQQWQSNVTRALRRLGLTWDDLKQVPGGEVGAARVLVGPGKTAIAVVLDVTGHLDEANEMLEKVSQNLTKQGAKRDEINVPGNSIRIIAFDVPPPQEDPNGPRRNVYYFLAGSLLGAADEEQVIEGILSRVTGGAKGSLAGVPAFQAVLARCRQDLPQGAVPQIRWYLHPVSFAEVVRLTTPEKDRRKGKSVYELLKNQGFEGVAGMGGTVDFAAEGFELIHRTFIYAPPPYEISMKMLSLPNQEAYEPQDWVPRDVATYTTLYFDILNAFDHFGPLFDELSGGVTYLFKTDLKYQRDLEQGVLSQEFRKVFQERRTPIHLAERMQVTTKVAGSVWEIKGKITVRKKVRQATLNVRKKAGQLRVYEVQTGIWSDVLESLRKDAGGPQIDLRGELIQYLGRRVTALTGCAVPITPGSERLLYAIETTDEEKVRAAVKKLMQQSAKRSVIDGHVIWESVGEEETETRPTRPDGLGPLVPEDDDDEEQPGAGGALGGGVELLPRKVVTVAYGHLFAASHLEFLLQALRTAAEGDPRKMLKTAVDYRVVDAEIRKLAIPEKCARMFSRTDEEYRATYELIREGKMAVAQTMLAQLLNRMFSPGAGEVRKQKIDGKNLPDYDRIRRSLGPAGTVVTSEAGGWFFKGFTLTKR